jgi:hypothetical protein
MWDAQWTCCGKNWEEPGCSQTSHKGVLVTSYLGKKLLNQDKWPNKKAQLYFKRQTGIKNDLWSEKIRHWRLLMEDRDSV